MRERVRLDDNGEIPKGQPLHRTTVPRLIGATGYAPRNLLSESLPDIHRISPDPDSC